jgi:hypothetical protein
MISNCLDPAAVKTLGSDLKGIMVSYSSGDDPKDPDTIEFAAILKKYNEKVVPHGTPVGSYVVWTAFNRVMKGATDITPDGIVAKVRASNGTIPVPTVKGASIKCDGNQVPGIAIACTASYLIVTLDEKGAAGTFSAP